MTDEDLWRRRFRVFMAVRLFGLATFFVGIAVAYSDLVRSGGWPALGAVLAVMGVLDALVAPRLLSRHWREQDQSD
jgi:hypothetical protein